MDAEPIDTAALAIIVASSYALNSGGEQPDPHLWEALTTAEGIVSGRISRLFELSDPKSGQLAQLIQTRGIINRLMKLPHDNDLGMKALE